jgi:hypothetical protein
MFRRSVGPGQFLVTLLATLVVVAIPAADQGQPAAHVLSPEQFKPDWRVGDRWIVETTTRAIQAPKPGADRGKPIRWQFSVQATEKVNGTDCYRVEAQPQVPGRPQPVTTFWVERQSLALLQFQTQLPVHGGFTTISEHYRFAGGQPVPVQSPLTALPIDMPVFVSNHAKSTQKFQYEAMPGPAGQKMLGDVTFATEIEQAFGPAKPEEVKGLLASELTKDVHSGPVAEIRLNSFQTRVRQLWQAPQPWPIYSENGTTVARLVGVTPAAR